MDGRVLLPVKRIKQGESECAIATVFSLIQYFDPLITYDDVLDTARKNVKDTKDGLYTSEQTRLLNVFGFDGVSIVTACLDMIDFSWSGFTKRKILFRLRKLRDHLKVTKDENLQYVDDMISWLGDSRYDNNLIISYDYRRYIQQQLDRGRPIGASFNWTAMFKYGKARGKVVDDIKGVSEDHAVVIRGYDKKGVFIVDSHYRKYVGRWKKYQSGFYKVPWDKFLVTVNLGDLILI